MFAAISGRYDLVNHLLTGGMDALWRRHAARLVATHNPQKVLDLATGSGDLAKAIGKSCPEALVVGADFCFPMLEKAKEKGMLALVEADGLRLPFRNAVFGAATVAFGLRNMASWPAALLEMGRVLQPGGLLLVMDFSLPEWPPIREAYRVYLHFILPHLAAIFTGEPQAYKYLEPPSKNSQEGSKCSPSSRKMAFATPLQHPFSLELFQFTQP